MGRREPMRPGARPAPEEIRRRPRRGGAPPSIQSTNPDTTLPLSRAQTRAPGSSARTSSAQDLARPQRELELAAAGLEVAAEHALRPLEPVEHRVLVGMEPLRRPAGVAALVQPGQERLAQARAALVAGRDRAEDPLDETADPLAVVDEQRDRLDLLVAHHARAAREPGDPARLGRLPVAGAEAVEPGARRPERDALAGSQRAG